MNWTARYRKALTFSYDDGNEQDVRLIALFDRYGMKATFNLNSGLSGDAGAWQYKGAWVRRLDLREAAGVYAGHEVAVHGAQHLALPELDDAALHRELADDVTALTALFGRAPVGMAYAYGAYDDRAVAEAGRLGLRYARGVDASHAFGVQTDLMRFRPTCHHNDDALFDLAAQFQDMTPDVPQIFYVWGHSYELDGDGTWDRLERLLDLLAGRDDIFYGTNAEVLL